jgi:NAD(P)H-hydrate epimerase
MRAIEAATFALGTTEAELQQRAGRAVAAAAQELQPSARSVLSLVGPGNNGRDAWIAAAGLMERGWEAALYLTPRHAIGDRELRDFVHAGGRLIGHPERDVDLVLESALGHAEVVLDGLLGIGARGAPRPPLDGIIATLNAAPVGPRRPFVVAVDNPSGLDADGGEADGIAVEADATVVLGAAKRGLLTVAAVPHTGRLVFADIGVVAGPELAAEVVDAPSLRTLLPQRAADAHKVTFGRLLVVAGSERYLGAAYLTCAAAVRAGAGVVTLAAPRWLRDVIAARLAEITYLPLPDAGMAGAPKEAATRILAELGSFHALALGPGLSLEGGVQACVEALLRERARRPLTAVVDADGINAVAQRPTWPSWIGEGVVMTPHAGELRRLTGEDDGADEPPWERARALAQAWKVALVLKGPFTAIGAGGHVWVHAGPNPALATAGTGDVLTGLIGGLLAQGMSPADAARLGVWAHGRAGALAAAGHGAGGLMASDLLDEIPRTLAALGATVGRGQAEIGDLILQPQLDGVG